MSVILNIQMYMYTGHVLYIPCDGIDSQNTNSSKVMLEYLAITPITLGHLNPPMSLCPDVTEIDVIADPVNC